MKKTKPTFIKGGIWQNERGVVKFVNDFTFSKIKRFYQIENILVNEIRAFHGHMLEEKYVYVVSGKILFCAVYIDNIPLPSKKENANKFILTADVPGILHIPAHYANGFRTLEPNSKVIFFSTFNLEESKNDDFRFPPDYWGQIWQ